ncbi:MAG: 16S rRNA (uracil(1498)-N(3))-methyltransferase [Firmicutes bacterium HGW-Firmicutes-12]|nr:MAG: 16S rRNA (uracil(1498)-N(3))-methyltransferase [Firmicutes bacterium HGW-Firmicutes-12]
MHRFIVASEGIEKGLAVIQGEELQHLTRVLRMTVGDAVIVFDGQGLEGHGTIIELEKNEALVSITSTSFFNRESPLDIWLVQGLAKGEKMDYIIQKATELGVRGIVPLETKRTVLKLEGKKKEEKRIRWQRIAQEAAKQCGRTCVPTVLPCSKIMELIEVLPVNKQLFVPWEQGGVSLKTAWNTDKRDEILKEPIYVVIGPEGGLDEDEVSRLSKVGGIPVTLGPRILRTETAGVVAITAIMYQWGDLE